MISITGQVSEPISYMQNLRLTDVLSVPWPHAGKGQSQLRVQAYLFLRQSFCLSYRTGHLDVTGREGPISLILILQVFRIVLVAFAAFSLKYHKQHVTENTEKLIPLGPSLFLNKCIH